MRSGQKIPRRRITIWLALELVFLGSPALARTQALPSEVVAFRARRVQCEHFMGEESYDKGRAAFLNREVKRYCTGIDKQLALLRRRYAGNRAVIDLLHGYEDSIE